MQPATAGKFKCRMPMTKPSKLVGFFKNTGTKRFPIIVLIYPRDISQDSTALQLNEMWIVQAGLQAKKKIDLEIYLTSLVLYRSFHCFLPSNPNLIGNTEKMFTKS